MTKKHFKALAEMMRESRPTAPKEDNEGRWQWDQWQIDCSAIAVVCQSFNSNFNTDKFFSNCTKE